MINILVYSLVSVVIVSLISLIGVLTIPVKTEKVKTLIMYLVSFSIGAFLGDILFHLLPESIEEFGGLTTELSVYFLCGFLLFFIIEKIIHWRHCHVQTSKEHKHPVGTMSLIGDAFHNFIDGLVIGSTYLVDTRLGVATTIAVIMHEIPQEIGDFGILLHAGYSKKSALKMNFITSLTAIFGVMVALFIGTKFSGLEQVLIPITAGGFLYIAASDLIPELKHEPSVKNNFIQLIVIGLGLVAMFLFKFLE